MSIRIDKKNCIGCRRCINVCPGSLIKIDKSDNKAYIKYKENCWGCASCIKECKNSAIEFFLGADILGNGSIMTVEEKDDILSWHIKDNDNNIVVIDVNRKDSNKY